MTKRELPKHVYRQRNGLYFQRRGWSSQKFENEFGTPEFWREYAGILSQKDKPRVVTSRTFHALIKTYHKSPRYANLKTRTALDYDKHLEFFASIMGDRNPAKMQRKDVIRLRDANADKAYFANYSLRVLRVLMEHCVDLGWRDTNPARGVPELKTVKKEREPWLQELLEAYRHLCPIGTRERLVMELCVGTGQRIGDVLDMRWSDIQDGAFFVRQSKTKKELWVPILDELQAALDAASRHSVFILTNEWGPTAGPTEGPQRLSGKSGTRSVLSTTTSIAGATTPHVSLLRPDAAMIWLRRLRAKARPWFSTTPKRCASGSERSKRSKSGPN